MCYFVCKRWGSASRLSNDKFEIMTHLRAAQLKQIAAFCELYSEAKQDGCTVKEKHATREKWGIKLQSALQFEALLEGNAELEGVEVDPARVREVLVPLIMHQRVQSDPVQVPPRELSFGERIAEALLELRNNGHQHGTLTSLAKKYNVGRKTIWRYRNVLKVELERDLPIPDPVFRQLVIRKAAERDRAQYAHQRYFSDFEEQMLVGILLGHDRASQPLTRDEFCALVRGILLAKFDHDPKRFRFVQSSDLHNWVYLFKKRHAAQLAYRKTQYFSVERAEAQDSTALDNWFAGVEQFERQWIEKGLIPASGLEPFQVLNYDESGLEPMGKHRFAFVSSKNRQCNRLSSADRSAFHVTIGCLTSAAGDVVTSQVIHSQANRRVTGRLADGLLPEPGDGTGATEDQPDTQEVEAEVDVDIFLSATENAWQDDITFHAFMHHMADALDDYRMKLGCPRDTPMFLFLDNHYSRSKDLERTKDIVELCTSKAIEIVFLPPHLSQCTQPNDCGLHSHLKAEYTKKLHEHLNQQIQQGRRRRVQKLHRLDFNTVFRETLKTISSDQRSKDVIRNGFRKAGLLPKTGCPSFEAPLLPAWYIPPEQRELPVEDLSDAEDEEPDDPEAGSNTDREDIPAPLQTPSPPPAPSEEAAELEDEATLYDSATLERMKQDISQRRLQLKEEIFNISLEEQRITSLERRLSGSSTTSLSTTDMQLTSPDIIFETLSRTTQTRLMRDSLKRVRTALVLDEEGNAPVKVLKTRYESQVARAAEKAREERRKKIAKYRRRHAFTVYCDERRIDMDNIDDEQALEITQEYDAYTSDKDNLNRLNEQWKWCPKNAEAQARLEKLKRRTAFIDFCYNAHQQPPENVEEADLFLTMKQFRTRPRPVIVPEPEPRMTEPAPEPEPEPEPIPRTSRSGRRIKRPREINI